MTAGALRRTLLTVVFLAALIAAQMHVAGRGPGYVGGLLLLKHVYDLTVTLTLLAICIAAGREVLRRLGLHIDEPIAGLAFCTAIGAGIVATLLLLLGSLGGLHTPGIALLLALVAILARRELRGVPSLIHRALAELRTEDKRPLLLVALLSLGVAASFLFALSLAPPVDWDTLMYHLQIPREFLDEGRIYVPEDNLHVSRVGLLHMLYLPLLAAGSSAGPAVLSAFLALILALAVFSLSRRLFGLCTAKLSLALFWGSTAIILVAITPRVDVSLALFLFLAHYAVLIALESSDDGTRHYYYLSAVLLGFAAGIKYHAMPYGVGIAPLAIWVAFCCERSADLAIRQLSIYAALVVAVAAPWLIKNWMLLDAPLYPFFSERLLEPWLTNLFGMQELPPRLGTRALQVIWDARASFNFRDAFLAPGNLSIESEGAYYFTNPALLLLPLWLAFVRNRKLNVLVIPAAIYLIVVLVPFPKTNLRYLIPALVPLTIVVASMASTIADRFLPERIGRPLLVGLAVLSLAPTARVAFGRLSGTVALEHLVGAASVHDYLATHALTEVRFYGLASRFVNTELPSDARILMLFEARGYYIDRDVIQDNQATNWSLLLSAQRPKRCLESSGITHVMLGVGAAQYYIAGGVDPEAVGWEALKAFANECLIALWGGPGLAVFRLR